MTTEKNYPEFQLSNTFDQYEFPMNVTERQKVFKEMGFKTFYFGK